MGPDRTGRNGCAANLLLFENVLFLNVIYGITHSLRYYRERKNNMITKLAFAIAILQLSSMALTMALGADVMFEVSAETVSSTIQRRNLTSSSSSTSSSSQTTNVPCKQKVSFRTSSSSDNNCHHVNELAEWLSSESFLRTLVSAKNTKEESYFVNEEDNSVSCEYVGTLWFMSRKGIDFRESLKMIGKEGLPSSSSILNNAPTVGIECHSKFRNAKGKWTDCAKVKCLLRSSRDQDGKDNIKVEISSELLVDIWMPSHLVKAIKTKISRTFEEAALSFLKYS